MTETKTSLEFEVKIHLLINPCPLESRDRWLRSGPCLSLETALAVAVDGISVREASRMGYENYAVARIEMTVCRRLDVGNDEALEALGCPAGTTLRSAPSAVMSTKDMVAAFKTELEAHDKLHNAIVAGRRLRRQQNIQHARAVQAWEALPWYRRWFKDRPVRPPAVLP